MSLKKYTSKSTNTFDRIQKCLAAHGAQKLMFDYGQSLEIVALSFAMEVEGRLIGFNLPARIEQVEIILKQHHRRTKPQLLHEQAYRTGWANIRDWVEAQMALIDTKMATLPEVFL